MPDPRDGSRHPHFSAGLGVGRVWNTRDPPRSASRMVRALWMVPTPALPWTLPEGGDRGTDLAGCFGNQVKASAGGTQCGPGKERSLVGGV